MLNVGVQAGIITLWAYLRGVHLISQQQTFDVITSKLLAQGCKSMSGRRCRYRGDNGTKCAVGHLIPDDKYSPSFEGHPCVDGPVADLLVSLGYDPDFCDELRNVHDNSPAERWSEWFGNIASRYGLSYAKHV